MVVVFDPQNSGIAGNMVLGAMLDLGADPDITTDLMEYSGSYFGDVTVKIKKTKKSEISATLAEVKCKDKDTITYNDLIGRLEKINHENISKDVLNFSKRVFKTLATAESKVHGMNLNDIHFHEVGAADAVADVIGTAYCFHSLGFPSKRIYSLPVALGGGRVQNVHGNLKIPAPATIEILRGVPVMGGPVDFELTTPTGAALLVNMVDEFCTNYPLIINRKIGYGAGDMDLEIPNVLRIVMADSTIPMDKISILETNLDNVTGEVLGHVFDRLLNEGALDVSLISTVMKKNRPGHLLRVISKPHDCDRLSEVIFRETGTLGVRVLPYVHRNILKRKLIPIKLKIKGYTRIINVKVGMINDEIINYSPEYEDAKSIANELKVPLKVVMRKAEEIFKVSINNQELDE
ncbi:MAG: nickel pincer cofactor biosynthesis protein LarC [Methanobacteriaceae archaeon]|nr:nickel pincer cofactor biosynthesis protein LarC [Methanobacteriaceae archaeon]